MAAYNAIAPAPPPLPRMLHMARPGTNLLAAAAAGAAAAAAATVVPLAAPVPMTPSSTPAGQMSMQQPCSASQSALMEGVAREGDPQSAVVLGVQQAGAGQVDGPANADTVMHCAEERHPGSPAECASPIAVAQLQAPVVVCCSEQAVSHEQ